MAFFSLDEWSDVLPIPQDDGPNPVVAIAYSKDFRVLMDYFRSVLKSQEYSLRSLKLTENILQHNAANYTVWQFRRDCLKAMSLDLNAELDYIDSFAEDNPKNYQIWNHRRVVVERLQDSSRELSFTERVFAVDPKNYHAWAHRQWAIKTFSLWDSELEYVNALLQDDIRNNSAWNQRWFVVHNRPVPVTGPSAEICEEEISYAWNALHRVKNNESAWNYLRGLAIKHSFLQKKVQQTCDKFIAEGGGGNPLALSLLADLCEMEKTPEGREKAIGCFSLLMDIDKVRSKSWRARLDALKIT